MGLNASTTAVGKPRTPPLDAGTYPARLVQVVDMGLQPRSYKGEDKEPAQEIILSYEFSDEFMLDEDGEEQVDKPRWLSETFSLFNLESEKAKSTSRYKSLDPKGVHKGDFVALLGTPILVKVIQNPKPNGRVYSNVAGISPIREKDVNKLPALVNSPRVFDLSEPNMDVFNELPEWVRNRITTNLEFKGSLLELMLEENGNEEHSDSSQARASGTDEATDNPY